MEDTGRHIGTDTNDGELLTRVGRADLEALGELYRRHGAAVFAAARRGAPDNSAAEVVTAEVFVALWDDPDPAVERGGDLRHYLIVRAVKALAQPREAE
jgi:DNA-directed RNA polymerase specialized sigma24 family protein